LGRLTLFWFFASFLPREGLPFKDKDLWQQRT
jgi:hypothetical protein